MVKNRFLTVLIAGLLISLASMGCRDQKVEEQQGTGSIELEQERNMSQKPPEKLEQQGEVPQPAQQTER